jgi:hypothetical protein
LKAFFCEAGFLRHWFDSIGLNSGHGQPKIAAILDHLNASTNAHTPHVAADVKMEQIKFQITL